ncbi:hypothetical protein PISMIDRAFT_448885 [Pisolithus microcarpus 441]|uniref:Uncharacterized protein n=1 Tax=Pisolithus microcarpus 441 TaxID=765257 RepID=A0A0C9Z3E3_9AGAM|nr:hypothetical protein PISMIDRAFT_448885 [Pisolithus microcarpus 441]
MGRHKRLFDHELHSIQHLICFERVQVAKAWEKNEEPKEIIKNAMCIEKLISPASSRNQDSLVIPPQQTWEPNLGWVLSASICPEPRLE